MKKYISAAAALLLGIIASAQNPYLPLWEHLPDGEPRVFEDPDNPGKFRVYIIGSHDVRFTSYCGPDIHEWSAPVEDPSEWRDEGAIFTYKYGDKWDVMYAPDLVEINRKDGSRVYYLYPHSRGWGREAMVCVGERPDGPFTPVNMTEDGSTTLEGSVFGFDPSVFVEPVTDPADPDFETGFRAYGYWGFQRSSAAQLDQETMWSARPGTEIIPYFIPASHRFGEVMDIPGAQFAVYEGEDLGNFNFFEASSIRQVGNKYVWVFSGHSGPDYGLESSNSTLRYAFSDSPIGPWKNGGVLVDSRGPVLGKDGKMAAGYSGHNTHGSLQFVNGQWYVFYHRAPRGFGFARQPMVAPVTISYDEIPVAEGGAVRITGYDPYTEGNVLTVKDCDGNEYKGAEVTSEGFAICGLEPYKYYSAGIACYLSDQQLQQDSWDVWANAMDICGVKNGDAIGYKYFDFNKIGKHSKLSLFLTPASGKAFTVEVWLDSPYGDGVKVGDIKVPAGADRKVRRCSVKLGGLCSLDKKHALYLVAAGEDGEPLFDLQGLGFSKGLKGLRQPVVPQMVIKVNGESIAMPEIPTRSTDDNGYISQDIYDVNVAVADMAAPFNVSASAKGGKVDISIAASESDPDCTEVKGTFNGKTKTFRIHKILPLVYGVENTAAAFEAPAMPSFEELPAIEGLPDPLAWADGSGRVENFTQWEKRRSEISAMLQHYEVGTKPVTDKSCVSAEMHHGEPEPPVMNGPFQGMPPMPLAKDTLIVKVTVNDSTLTIHCPVVYPEGDGPFPAIIGLGFGAGAGSLPSFLFSRRGIAMIGFPFSEVMEHTQTRGEQPINALYPEYVDMGAYAAWPWGVSRVIDALEILGDQSRIDTGHLAISGCSFAGKMALWSGALDERIALTIAQEPGGGGAAAWRVSETLGEVETVARTNYSWFIEDMRQFSEENVAKLPIDHHELCALVAPRALLVLGNPDYPWLADEAGYVSCVAARKVWEAFGIGDRMGWSFQDGHMHCQLPREQWADVEAFVDRFMLDQEVSTDVRKAPMFEDTDLDKWIKW